MAIRKTGFMVMILSILCIYSIWFSGDACAMEKTFIKEYTYAASDLDSKVSSRTIALEQVKRFVIEELGTYLRSDTEVKNFELTRDQLTAFSAGFIRMSVIDEKWDGKTYFVKVQVTTDPNEVARSIGKIRADQAASRAIEETGRKADQSLNEIERLKKEIETMKGEDNKRKEYDRAVGVLSSREWFDRGYALITAGNYQEAIPVFLKVVELEPDNVNSRVSLAWAYNGAGLFKKAMVQLDIALSLEPDNEYVYMQRGWSCDGLGEFKRAIAELNKALALNPDDPWALYNRAWASNATGDFPLAARDMDRALKLNPGQASFYSMRGWAYNGLLDFRAALADLNTASKLDPKDKYNFIQRAWAQNGLGNFERAENDFTASINIDPKFAEGYYNLAIFYYYREGKEKALIFLARAVELDANLKARARTDPNLKDLYNDAEFSRLVN
jgi:tetratricopeptide (TPR) repeat protein